MVIVSPFPRLANASQNVEWFAGVRNALLAYCNHGPCGPTFVDVSDLDGKADLEVEAMLKHFVEASPELRLADGLCQCPPFLRRAWQLGQARTARAEHRLSELSKVLQGAATFTSEETDVTHPGGRTCFSMRGRQSRSKKHKRHGERLAMSASRRTHKALPVRIRMMLTVKR